MVQLIYVPQEEDNLFNSNIGTSTQIAFCLKHVSIGCMSSRTTIRSTRNHCYHRGRGFAVNTTDTIVTLIKG